MAEATKAVEFEDGELKLVEYAVQQYINKIQEVIAEEHSGVGRFMLESNLISAQKVLEKVSTPSPVAASFEDDLSGI